MLQPDININNAGGMSLRGVIELQEAHQKKQDIALNVTRIEFLANEIRIAREFHVNIPNKREEAEVWAQACERKIQLIKEYLVEKYQL